jgi:hypothetical protein
MAALPRWNSIIASASNISGRDPASTRQVDTCGRSAARWGSRPRATSWSMSSGRMRDRHSSDATAITAMSTNTAGKPQ